MMIVFMAVTVTATSAYNYFPYEKNVAPSSVVTFSAGYDPVPVGCPIRKRNRNTVIYGKKAVSIREFNEAVKPDRNANGWKDRSKYRTEKRKNHPIYDQQI